MEDVLIIEAFFARAESAITSLDRKYGRFCRSIAGRILSDARDVDECVSDAYMSLWNTIPPLQPISLRAYLARVIRNIALDRHAYNTAAKRSSALTDAFEELELYLPSSSRGPEQVVEEQSFSQFINAFLEEQSKDARIFFVRRYWYGESIREIADSCHSSEAKIKTSLFRTRARLRDAMEKEGIHL